MNEGEQAGAPDDPVPDDLTDDEKGPLRRCIVSGVSGDPAGMVRFVVDPEGVIVPDVEGRLPGRGIWLSARRDVVNTAVTKSLFAKAARRKVQASADLADRIEALLTRRCLDILSLARRAGQAVAGFDKVAGELKSRRAVLVLEAKDAAEGGRGKLRALANAVGVPAVAIFTAAELAQAFGRDHVVHVAVSPGGLAVRLEKESARLAGFRQASE